MRVRFHGIARPVAFDGCPELADRLLTLTEGWRWEPTPDDGDAGITVTARSDAAGIRWRIVSDWTPQPADYDDEADILCALIADLILAYVETRGDLLCLHAGAVALGASPDAPLFAFPAETLGGKSTLTAALAASGGRLYSDDVLPVQICGAAMRATALGIMPRPRLPLPATMPATLRETITRRLVIANRRFGYAGLARGQLAPLGESRAIAAFVALERAPGNARLTAAPRAETLSLLLRQNFGARPPAADLVERLAAMTAAARCWRLRYSDIGEAVALLTAEAQNAAMQQRVSA